MFYAAEYHLANILFKKVFRNARKNTTEIVKTEPIIYVLLGIMGVFLLFNWRALDNVIDTNDGSKDSVVSFSNMLTIVCNDGTIEELYYDELLEAYSNNPAEFEKKYIGAKISFIGGLEGIGLNSYGDGKKYRSLTFAEGWRLEFPFEGYEFIDEANAEGRLQMLSVETFISRVVEYEEGKP